MYFTNGMLEKAKKTKSADELLAIAKENGVEISTEDAAELFVQMHKTGELSDEELDNVSGGCDKEEVTHKYNKGDKVMFKLHNSDKEMRYGIIYWFFGYNNNNEERYEIIWTDETFTIEKGHIPLVPESCIKPA